MSQDSPNLRIVADAAPAVRRSRLSELEQAARLATIAGMRAKRWNVARLAHESGCSHDSIERYLSGRRPVPGKVLVALGVVVVDAVRLTAGSPNTRKAA